MKYNPFATFLVMVLAVVCLGTATLAYAYIQASRDLARLQAQANGINRHRNHFQGFGAELLEYYRKNPNIGPLLQSMGIQITNTTRGNVR